jgi:hypothetical protein
VADRVCLGSFTFACEDGKNSSEPGSFFTWEDDMSDLETIKSKFESLRPVMDERMCRLWAACEARSLGHGGETVVAAATGLSPTTVRAGLEELGQLASVKGAEKPRPARRPSCSDRYRVRLPGGGRKPVEVKDPGILPALKQLIENDEAGDPMGKAKWVRVTPHRLSEQLTEKGHKASAPTVSRLLKEMGYSMKANRRRQVHSKDPERDQQFRYIASQRERFKAADLPVISVDTKKKELIGNFRNHGKAWCKEAEEVNEHDFPGGAECKAVPFGIYDVVRNVGHVVVGVSNNTPEFTANAIAGWWRDEGRLAYPGAKQLLILGDGGGGNGSRARVWKLKIQELLCDAFGLEVTVCHYPPGCSKWNPVEHRLFSQISRNWAGKPLRSLDFMLACIRGTTTATGLKVTARLDEGVYRKGLKVSRDDLARLDLTRQKTCPHLNYTIRPRPKDEAAPPGSTRT